MDALDLDIVRWMYPRGVWSGSGTDPRVTTSAISRRIGISREAVWARLRRWRKEGFLPSIEVVPNSRAFGVHRYQVEIHTHDPADGDWLLDRLESVDGIWDAQSSFGESTTDRAVHVVTALFVARSHQELTTRRRSFAQLAQKRRMNGPFSAQPPPLLRPMSLLDWRVLSAYRACMRSDPFARVSEVAATGNLNARVLVRRRNEMASRKAIFWIPNFGWALHPSATLLLVYKSAEDRPGILAAVRERFPKHLPIDADLEDVGEYSMGKELDSRRWVAARVPAISQAHAQRLVGELSSIPGVLRVYNEVAGKARWYRGWVDGEIEARLHSVSRRATSPLASRTRVPRAGRRGQH